MPYTPDDFPLKTNRPRIDVTLPVGRHEFELVVVDSAGLRSAPDRIVVYVEKEEARPPAIQGIDKTFGLRGERIETFVRGSNLRDATDIRFTRIEASRSTRAARSAESSGASGGVQLDARILAGGTENELRVAIRIPGNAALGEYGFSVTTRAGTAESPVNFLVTAKPEVSSYGPARTHPNETSEVVIEGRYLLIPTLEPDYADPAKPLRHHSIEIIAGSGAGEPVAQITTEIVKEGSSPEALFTNINVGQGVAPGEYRLRVKTPAGWTDAEESFLVQGE